MPELVRTNRTILHYIKSFSNKSSRIGAATQFGMSIGLIDQISNLTITDIDELAEEYANNGLIITCTNFEVRKIINGRVLSIDSYFKSSLQEAAG
jgi:hypothetical protein